MGKWLVLGFMVGCANTPDPAMKAQTQFDNFVYPILSTQCTGNTSGCHARSNGLVIDADRAIVYQNAVSYAGDFTATAPLLTRHQMPPIISDQFVPDELAVIEAWFADEREARGL